MSSTTDQAAAVDFRPTVTLPLRMDPVVVGAGRPYYVVVDAKGRLVAQGSYEMCQRVVAKGGGLNWGGASSGDDTPESTTANDTSKVDQLSLF